MNKNSLYEYRADFLLLTVAIAWGVTFLMVQEAVESTPVYAFFFFFFIIAAFLMGIIFQKQLRKLDRKTIIFGVTLGFFLFWAFATQTFGLTYTKSSIVAFITGLSVVCVPFLSFILFKENIKSKTILASVVAVVGLYLLTMSGTLNFQIGEFLTLLCAFLFASHIVFTGKFSRKVNVFNLVFIQFLTVALLSLIMSLLVESRTFTIDFDFAFYKAVLVTSIFATVYAFMIQTYMQQFTTTTKTAIIFTMEPVSAAFYGYYVGNEILSFAQIIGAFLIITATLIAELRFKKLSN